VDPNHLSLLERPCSIQRANVHGIAATEAAKLAGAPGGRQRIFKDLRYKGTHRPATNRKIPPLDGSIKTFERGDALWSDDAYSDVVPSEDSSIRLALDQSPRAHSPTKLVKTCNPKQSTTWPCIGLHSKAWGRAGYDQKRTKGQSNHGANLPICDIKIINRQPQMSRLPRHPFACATDCSRVTGG